MSIQLSHNLPPLLPSKDLALIRDILVEELPEASDLPLTLQDGWDNVVVFAGDQWVLRFPQREDYPFERELEILKLLKPKLSVAVPEVGWIGKRWRGVAYRMIAGRHAKPNDWSKLQRETLGIDIGLCFAQMHTAMTGETAKSQGWPRHATLIDAESLNKALERLPADLRSYGERIAKLPEPQYGISLLHGDLHASNFLVNEDGRLTGILDFTNVGCGDVSYEFHPIYRLHHEILNSALKSYADNGGVVIAARDCALLAARYALGLLAWDSPDAALFPTISKVALTDLRRYSQEKF